MIGLQWLFTRGPRYSELVRIPTTSLLRSIRMLQRRASIESSSETRRGIWRIVGEVSLCVRSSFLGCSTNPSKCSVLHLWNAIVKFIRIQFRWGFHVTRELVGFRKNSSLIEGAFVSPSFLFISHRALHYTALLYLPWFSNEGHASLLKTYPGENQSANQPIYGTLCWL